MTTIFFIRHAQPDERVDDDRNRPLTATGLADREKVTEILAAYRIDRFYSSPFKRALDTVAHMAAARGMEITTDERLRERRGGPERSANGALERRWADFTFAEPGGECLKDTQERKLMIERGY